MYAMEQKEESRHIERILNGETHLYSAFVEEIGRAHV